MSEAQKIEVTKNQDGRAIATLYGKQFDLTEMADPNGKGEFKAFGKTYEFQILQRENAKVSPKQPKSAKKVQKTPESGKNIDAKVEDIPINFEESK
jgi:hypothetical protein